MLRLHTEELRLLHQQQIHHVLKSQLQYQHILVHWQKQLHDHEYIADLNFVGLELNNNLRQFQQELKQRQKLR
jgi:hypothetical protein